VPGDRNPAAGGLATVLANAVVPGSLWLGWSGRRAADTAREPRIATLRGVTYATLDIGETDYRRYYVGFANGALYPLLLFRLGLMNFRQEDLAGYLAVNRAFAEALRPLLADDDLIWVHDYQLLTVGQELRRLGVRQPIGFFLHTPFAPPAVFEALPCAAELIDALCACDVIGFHTEGYREAFLACVASLLGARADSRGRFRHRGREVRTIVTPVGIDAPAFAATAARNAAGAAGTALADSLRETLLGVSVDRLDYAKGQLNRIQALQMLFEAHPEHRRRTMFLQVAAPSREEVADYRSLRRELDHAVGNVNGRYSEADWTPIRYLTRPVRRPTLAAYYRLARLGIVTPLRDGMNLVAKEFVAAQNAADPGVLILSRFAGAAEELTEALIVNPFDAGAIAEAMHRALTMPLDERKARHRPLMTKVRVSSARQFCESFLAELRAVATEDPADERPIPLAVRRAGTLRVQGEERRSGL
jgi:trehalose 6-phosphate synthase